MRLQKFLSSAGACSRRKGEEYIKNGQVTVNGKIVTELGTKVASDADIVLFKGVRVSIDEEMLYMALNKPPGYVTTCSQPGEKIVLDLVDCKRRVYPVGRLDKDSKGLLLLTSDGRIHHGLSHPSFDHEKEYLVTVSKNISDKDLSIMRRGVQLDGIMTRPATVKRRSLKSFNIILKEGRNRQIRRMVTMVDNRVTVLKRIRFSNVILGDLKEGSWRYLSEQEKDGLLKNIEKPVQSKKPEGKPRRPVKAKSKRY